MGDNKDWVDVQLSPFGEQYLKQTGGGPLRVHEGSFEFAFEPGKPQRVTRAFDWQRVLKQQHIGGNPLFVIAPAPAANAEAQLQAESVAKELAADGTGTTVQDGHPVVFMKEVQS